MSSYILDKSLKVADIDKKICGSLIYFNILFLFSQSNLHSVHLRLQELVKENDATTIFSFPKKGIQPVLGRAKIL